MSNVGWNWDKNEMRTILDVVDTGLIIYDCMSFIEINLIWSTDHQFQFQFSSIRRKNRNMPAVIKGKFLIVVVIEKRLQELVPVFERARNSVPFSIRQL